MAKKKYKPVAVKLADVLKLVDSASIPLAGFEEPALANRSNFAAFNMGRFQQHLIHELGKLKPVR